MSDLRPTRNSAADTATPRWVKVFAIIAIVLVLLLVIHFLARGGPGMHGVPGLHAPPAGGQTPS
jgi:hypothetical protein